MDNQKANTIIAVLSTVIETKEARLKGEIAAVRSARTLLGKVKNEILTFSISIKSRWSDDGEPSLLEYEVTGEIFAAMDEAAKEFRKLAKRSDIQANWEISVLLRNRKKEKISVPVPLAFFQEYSDRISKPL